MTIKIALAGNPNSGKTTLFNALTGSNQYVGNWPGVTVEKKEGKLKGHKEAILVDLPGVYSLSPYTLEEVVTRNFLSEERPDVIINIIDGSNLERNLYLTTQLVELGIPTIVAVNMMDIVRKNGDKLNSAILGNSLGCEVVEISALKSEGIKELADKAVSLGSLKKAMVPQHSFCGSVEHAIAHIEEAALHDLPPERQRWYAIKLFERDQKIIEQLKLSEERINHIENDIIACEAELDDDAEGIITNERYIYISSIIGACYERKRQDGLSTSDKIDRIVTNRVLALPIFAVVMVLVYYISVSSVGSVVTDWANEGVFGEGWHLAGIGNKEYTKNQEAYDETAGAVVAFGDKSFKIVSEYENAALEKGMATETGGDEPSIQVDGEKAKDLKVTVKENVMIENPEAEEFFWGAFKNKILPKEISTQVDYKTYVQTKTIAELAEADNGLVEAEDSLAEAQNEGDKALIEAAQAEVQASEVQVTEAEKAMEKIGDLTGVTAYVRGEDAVIDEEKPVNFAHYKESRGELSLMEEPDPKDYGIWVAGIPIAVKGFLVSVNAADWLQSLILDGIVAGVGAVLGFVPQMFVLFLFLAILESCGYMARVAFIMDRIFRKFGLSGKSFIPILIGTGCGVPGIMASRTIENDRDRKMTIITTTFIPCGAKLPIIALIAGAMFGGAWWVSPSAYFIGIGAIISSGIILKKTRLFAGNPAPFVMELPAYHMPVARNVLLSMWERGWSFIKKAGTLVLLATVIIWYVSGYGWTDGSFGAVENMDNSILAKIGGVIAPVFAPVGWGTWQGAAAAISGLTAKEIVVGMFGVLYGGFEGLEGSGWQVWENLRAAFTPLAAYSFLVFNLLCAPCFAAMGAIKREMNNWKWTAFAIGYQTLFAYAVALVVYQVGMFVTTGVFNVGFVVAIALIVGFIYLLFRPYKDSTKISGGR